MGTPSVNDLDGLMSSLNQLKAPGASKNKIAAITTLCVNNIQSETAIVQSFYRALKKAPATHKLGALYVIDSVVRQWIEKARAAGLDLNIEGRGEPGTYPAAVKRVTELMPALFDDIMKGIPADQKPKLQNMITIWERGSTFPAKMQAEFKGKLGVEQANGAPASAPVAAPAPAPAPVVQHGGKIAYGAKFMAPIPTKPLGTPPGQPPRHLYDQGFLPGYQPPLQANGAMPYPQEQFQQPLSFPPQQMPAQAQPVQNGPPQDVNSILAALSRAAPAAPTPMFPPAPQSAAPAPALPAGIPPQLAALFQQQSLQSPVQPQFAYSAPPAQPVPTPTYQHQFNGYPPQQPPSIPQAYSFAPPPPQPPQQQAPPADPLAPLRGLLPENILNDRQKLIHALTLLQDLQKEGIPPEKWGPVLTAFQEQYEPPQSQHTPQGKQGRNRNRSRSPDRGARGGRGSPVYGAYDANARSQQPAQGHDMQSSNQRGRYRQRSPIRNSPGTVIAWNGQPMKPKIINYDGNLPRDNIKVLSRTLFVGGANGTQQEIHDLFERFGQVQSCIGNRDKRHAFVKMTTREHALAAKAAMEDLQNRNDRDTMNIARQTKWGVGFGPRECCDYQRGESIIPIHKLTEADLKWLHTAEYGGTGGQKLEGGMVLEEPDIEIGAGVSSKAMSKRIGPENGQSQKRQRDDGGHHGGRGKKNKGGHNHQDYMGGYSGIQGGPPPPMQYDYMPTRPEPVAVATPPAVPGFGFSLGLPGQGGHQ